MDSTQIEKVPAALHAGPIRWRPWSDDAFALAAADDKLVLVDVGAVWCHWCHVMDRTTYDHPDVAGIVNAKFVPIRVDRDQRPDVDARLQRAVSLIRSEANGWPLTVVLTPAGHVLYKATYLPPTPDPQFGLGLGLIDLLEQLDKVYRQQRGELDKAGKELQDRVSESLRLASQRPGPTSDHAIEQVAAGIAARFDTGFGGFGGEGGPKFPQSAAVDLCLLLAERQDDSFLRRIAMDTLDAMARGGIHDHLGGGFHRYSVDRHWLVPHFEKMAGENGALLVNFARAFAVAGEATFREAADGILRFMREVLYDHESGGFYGSQDADIGLHDDGDYFTWTLDEVRRALDGPQFDAAVHYYDIREFGEMRQSPDRNVLHVTKSVEQLARLMRIEPELLSCTLRSANEKLLQARRQRPTPWIDKTIFADANGGLIRACCEAHKLLQSPDALDMASRAADRVMRQCLHGDGRLRHYLLPPGPKATGATECEVFGHLSDHAYMAWGLLGLYSITGERHRLDSAVKLLEHIVDSLEDREGGGFFDLPEDRNDRRKGASEDSPVLDRFKPWDDSPVQSPNSIACIALLEAWRFAGRDEFRNAAERALQSMAGAVQPDTGLFMAGWALAADALLHPPTHVVVLANLPEREAMLQTAWSAGLPGRTLTEPLSRGDASSADRLAQIGAGKIGSSKRPVAIVCDVGSCRPPAHSPQELEEILRG